MRIAEFLHGQMPYISVLAFAVAYLVYDFLFRVAARSSGSNPDELGMLIPLTFALIGGSIAFVVWRGYFS